MKTSPDSIAVRIVDDPIVMPPLYDFLADPNVGSHGWFFGVTRRKTADKMTKSLSYAAHRPMAITELTRLANDAFARFKLTRLLIVHRLGDVPVGHRSVVIGCSSAHRKETFAALPWLMDQIKHDVPIWKQERFVDGTAEWVHPSVNGTGDS